MAIRTLFQRDALATLGIIAECDIAAALAFGIDRKGPRVPAFRVIRAADKGAEAAKLQAQAASAAARAQPRVSPGSVIRKEMPAEFGVERLQHRLDGQFAGAVD